ncbi:hypothetical protein ACVWW1_000496 [Bradyrhizobium sp. JR3.5]
MRVQRFVERVLAEVGCLVDGVGLADRVEDDAALFGDVVDRKLNRRGQTADDEIHLLFLDQLQCPRCRFTGIELVVAHDKLGLAAVETASIIELGDSELTRPHLVLGLGAIRTGQGNREADLDGCFLGLEQIDAKRRDGESGAGACRRQQTTPRYRSSFGDLVRHDYSSPRTICVLFIVLSLPGTSPPQIRPKAVRIT